MYVYVKDYHQQLQHALNRYQHIMKEVITLLSSPEHLDFSVSYKYEEGASILYKDYVSILEIL